MLRHGKVDCCSIYTLISTGNKICLFNIMPSTEPWSQGQGICILNNNTVSCLNQKLQVKFTTVDRHTDGPTKINMPQLSLSWGRNKTGSAV